MAVLVIPACGACRRKNRLVCAVVVFCSAAVGARTMKLLISNLWFYVL
jgi:hypothetical protein